MISEAQDALSRGSIRRLTVAESYAVEVGRLVERRGPGQSRDYLPFAYPGIVEQFSKLVRSNEVDLIRFARKWGLLGVGETAVRNATGDDVPGDDVELIWRHVEQVKALMDLIAARREFDDDRLGLVLKETFTTNSTQEVFVFEFVLSNGDSRGVLQTFTSGEKDSHLVTLNPELAPAHRGPTSVVPLPNIDLHSVPGEFRRAEGRRRLLADIVVQEVINRNMECPVKIVMPEFGRLERSYVFGSLMEVIYTQLADYAVGDWVYVRCKHCKSLFRQTDPRQRYCPHIDPDMESLCSARARKKRLRKNQEMNRSRSTTSQDAAK